MKKGFCVMFEQLIQNESKRDKMFKFVLIFLQVCSSLAMLKSQENVFDKIVRSRIYPLFTGRFVKFFVWYFFSVLFERLVYKNICFLM